MGFEHNAEIGYLDYFKMLNKLVRLVLAND